MLSAATVSSQEAYQRAFIGKANYVASLRPSSPVDSICQALTEPDFRQIAGSEYLITWEQLFQQYFSHYYPTNGNVSQCPKAFGDYYEKNLLCLQNRLSDKPDFQGRAAFGHVKPDWFFAFCLAYTYTFSMFQPEKRYLMSVIFHDRVDLLEAFIPRCDTVDEYQQALEDLLGEVYKPKMRVAKAKVYDVLYWMREQKARQCLKFVFDRIKEMFLMREKEPTKSDNESTEVSPFLMTLHGCDAALMHAAVLTENTRVLCQQVNFWETTDEFSTYAVLLAGTFNCLASMKVLLGAGVSPNECELHGTTALHEAIRYFSSQDMLALLIKHSQPGLLDYEGKTPQGVAQKVKNTVAERFLSQHSVRDVAAQLMDWSSDTRRVDDNNDDSPRPISPSPLIRSFGASGH